MEEPKPLFGPRGTFPDDPEPPKKKFFIMKFFKNHGFTISCIMFFVAILIVSFVVSFGSFSDTDLMGKKLLDLTVGEAWGLGVLFAIMVGPFLRS